MSKITDINTNEVKERKRCELSFTDFSLAVTSYNTDGQP